MMKCLSSVFSCNSYLVIYTVATVLTCEMPERFSTYYNTKKTNTHVNRLNRICHTPGIVLRDAGKLQTCLRIFAKVNPEE